MNNTKYQVREERYGKVDCVIQTKEKDYSKKEPKALILYELKTFIKPMEKLKSQNSVNKIFSDFIKLKKLIVKNKNVKGYFILVCTKNKLKDLNDNFFFIVNYKEESKKWHTIEDKDNKVICRLRPSGKMEIGKTNVFIWEIR